MPKELTSEQVSAINEAAIQFHEAMAEIALEAVLEIPPENQKKLARELDKIKREQEDEAIEDLAQKFGERHSVVAKVFRNYVPF